MPPQSKVVATRKPFKPRPQQTIIFLVLLLLSRRLRKRQILLPTFFAYAPAVLYGLRFVWLEAMRHVKLQRPLAPPAASHLKGRVEHIRIHEGLDRTALLYQPVRNEEGKPRALVIAFHGSLESGQIFRCSTTGCHLDELAEERGLVVAYPDGMMGNWNDGREATYPAKAHNVDDVHFTRLLIDEAHRVAGIDKERVFVLGFSNGGHMCLRLLAELGSQAICAGSSIGANLVPEPRSVVDYANHENSKPPFPFALLNGTKDPIIPYDGGEGALWTSPFGLYQYGKRGEHYSSQSTAARLASRWGNGNTKASQVPATGGIRVTDYRSDEGKLRVRSVALLNEGHRVSHVSDHDSCPSAYGPRRRDLDALREIIKFFDEVAPGQL